MSSSKELFNKFKTRPPGTNAGFIVEDGGEMTILDPTQMRSMNPQKLRSRMKKKGVAGTFYKGSKGPVFNVMAGKQGGNAEQPWVKQKLRQELGVSMLEVVTDGAAEMEEAAGGDAPSGGSSGPPVVGLDDADVGSLDLLDAVELLDTLEELPEELGGLLDALEAPDLANLQAFLARKAQVAAALYALEDHPHKAHLREDILAGEEAIHAAQIRAESGLPGEADAQLDTVEHIAQQGRARGEAYQAYRTARAEVLEAARVVDSNLKNPHYVKEVSGADKLAGPPDRDYAAAEARLQEILKAVRGDLTKWYITEAPDVVAKLKAMRAAHFVQPELAEIERLLGQVPGHLAAGNYLKAHLTGQAARVDLAGDARKRAKRRARYDSARRSTLRRLKRIEDNPHLTRSCAAVRARIAEADALASRERMRIEAGKAIHDELSPRLKALQKIGRSADELWERVRALEPVRAGLTSHPQTHQVAEELRAGVKLMQIALGAVGLPVGTPRDTSAAPLPADVSTDGFAPALDALDQARVHFDAAQERLRSSAALVGLRDSARDAPDADALRTAARAAEARAATVGASPHLAVVSAEHADAVEGCAWVLGKLEGGGPSSSIEPLRGRIVEVTQSLLVADRVLISHGAYLSARAQEEEGLATLRASPLADRITARTDEVESLLQQAASLAAARAYVKADQAVGRAGVALAGARKAAEQRQRFEDRIGADASSGLRAAVGALVDDAAKAKAQAHLDTASALADGYRFDAANRALDEAEVLVKVGELKAQRGMASDEADYASIAYELMKLEGGAEALDAFVAGLPASSSAFPIIQELAGERFGIDLQDEGAGAAGYAKRIWKLLTLCPDEAVRNNPSLEVIERRTSTNNGGFYDGSKNLVCIENRPGSTATQKLGSDIQSELGEVEDNCKPRDEKAVAYFDWATLHEVGHAVDDRLGFMTARAGQAAFGDWAVLSGALDVLITAVAAHVAGPAADAFRPCVEAVVGGADVSMIEEPDGFPGSWFDCWDALNEWYALATNKKVWWSESDSQKLKLGDGYIYQEAYKGTWVRYAAAARKRGLTGYQFRAPGEWFAELYAAYHSGKLKPAHPSAVWLSQV